MLEVGQVINGAAEWVCGGRFIYGILRNPVVTALLVTVLAMVVIFAMHRPTCGWQTAVRGGVYLFLGVSALMYVHYYALGRALRSEDAQKGIRDVVAAVHHAGGTVVYGGDTHPVTPGFIEPVHGLRSVEASFRDEHPKLVKESCGCEAEDKNLASDGLKLATVVMPSVAAAAATVLPKAIAG